MNKCHNVLKYSNILKYLKLKSITSRFLELKITAEFPAVWRLDHKNVIVSIKTFRKKQGFTFVKRKPEQHIQKRLVAIKGAWV